MLEATLNKLFTAFEISNDAVLANYQDCAFVGRLSKPFRLQDLALALEEALGPSA